MADKEIISKPFSIGAGKFDSASLAIFKYILDVRSMTVIERKVEDKLAFDNPEDEIRTALNSILAANKLDEVWAICHDMLGQPDQAQILRDWLSKPKVDTGSEVTLLTEELANGETNYLPAEINSEFMSTEHTPDVPPGNHKQVINAEGVVAQLESVADEWNVNVEADITARMQQRKELLESMPENLQDAYTKTVQVERRPATQADLSKIHMEGYKDDGWHREIVNGEMTGFMIRSIKPYFPDMDVTLMYQHVIQPLDLSNVPGANPADRPEALIDPESTERRFGVLDPLSKYERPTRVKPIRAFGESQISDRALAWGRQMDIDHPGWRERMAKSMEDHLKVGPVYSELLERIADDWTAVEPSDRSELLHIPSTPFGSMRFEQLVIKYAKQYGFTVYRTPGGRMVDLKSNKDFLYTLDGLNEMLAQYTEERVTPDFDKPNVSEDDIILSREVAERLAATPFGGVVMMADTNWKKVLVQHAVNSVLMHDAYECSYAIVEGYGKTRTVYLPNSGAVEINNIHIAKAAGVAARKGWKKVVLFEYESGDLHALNLAQVIVHWNGQLLPRVFESADTFVA